ncbi:MAG: biotin--[acetyl-CoA-carboxylase] ligase [bacterium]|nr:biotin--[acetyl-CoA-carboxylase] ligase [bacterium]
MATPYDTIFLDEVTSTQDVATVELRRRARPVLIVANRQTQGRGRSSNDWWQATSAIAASLAFPHDTVKVSETFSLVVGLAVRLAIRQVADVDVQLKWPNDIEQGGRKVGGILVETDPERVVVGCGLNLWWPEAPHGAGALFGDEPSANSGRLISEAWATSLLADRRWDRSAYLQACSTIGAELTWDPDGHGTAKDIDARGGLVVSTTDGAVTLRSGEVRTVRKA